MWPVVAYESLFLVAVSVFIFLQCVDAVGTW